MADNCCAPIGVEDGCTVPTTNVTARCPACGHKGKPVDTQTVKALLAVSLERVQPVAYFFCCTSNCPVVYFSAAGQQTFTINEVRERVHQKEPQANDVFVCYCFRHTPGSIRAELLLTNESTIAESITAGVKAGQCACEIRNPQGSCCLGNVNAVVKHERAAIHKYLLTLSAQGYLTNWYSPG